MIKFSLPGYLRHRDLILFFTELYKHTPDIFLPNRVIDSAYDFPALSWNGGREGTYFKSLTEQDIYVMYEHIQPLRDSGVKIRHTCTNSLVEERHLKDTLCNLYLNISETEGDSIIVASPVLKEYIKQTYPKYSIINSTTLCLDNIDDFNKLSKKELTVMNYNYNCDDNYLKQLKYPENIEILCAEGCQPNCPQRKEHYLSICRANLYKNEPRFFCNYAGIHNIYINFEKIPHMVNNQRIEELHNMGIENFKIAGRNLAGPFVLELLLYYLIKPEYQNVTRCEAMIHFVAE